ncbi:hypothetical protein Alsa3_CDS0034 [Staphylococcus phage Alsa_3]|nr:hypothetical protein Alsa3_CDS0034 [Staphylococcus phage Alsa_3]WNM51154.1 hypothetical protein Alsa4_CDS0024 [Staphylococcus phage Alsa_4]
MVKIKIVNKRIEKSLKLKLNEIKMQDNKVIIYQFISSFLITLLNES